jgi:cytoskeleton protein RodZ
MAETNQTKPSSAQEVKEPTSNTGLGAVLKNEREKKGLTLDQVACITKLRARMVEALENETWGDLPQPVFVRGFIRSYAGVLGLDGKELLHLYERVSPSQAAAGKPVEAQRRSYKRLFLPAVILVLILGFISYLRVEHPSPPGEPVNQKRQAFLEGGKEKRDAVPTADQAQGGGEGTSFPAQGTAAFAPAVPSLEVEKTRVASAPAEPQAVAQPSDAEPQAGTVPPDAYELNGVVLDETWVRIRIDNGASKEYIFQPGARTQWKAKNGFYLTVGNAAGIELELNGTKLKSLGKPGKVVKLNLPASFRPTRTED